MAMKLYTKKAYDRSEWDFTEKYLTDSSFCDRWINCIVQCVTSTSFKVIVNQETRFNWSEVLDIEINYLHRLLQFVQNI